MEWYIKVLKQYADFSGRARRKEYWMFTLFNIIMMFVLMFVIMMVKGSPAMLALATIAYSLYIIIPSIAVVVRRLHDIGKSGWWYFIVLVPLVGGILLIVWLCTDSQADENNWGANPKELE